MKFWDFVHATARLVRRVGKCAWNVKAQFIRMMEDFAHLITGRERLIAQAYILNLK